MADVIDQFTGPYRFLSNFYAVQLTYRGIEYPSAEHAFNAGKTVDLELRRWIAAAPNPGEAKRRGRSVELRPEWDRRIRYEVMSEVLQAKFSQPYLRRLLLSTGEAELVEGNTWHDMHWGRCVCPRHHGFGANWLGLMLEKIRADLRQYA